MKKFFQVLMLSIVAFIFWQSCEKSKDIQSLSNNSKETESSALTATISSNLTTPVSGDPSCTGPYKITLETVTNNGNGTWTWTWSVQNPNPGNGTGGTIQNLSHWDVTLGQCVKIEDVVSGATSADGITYTPFTVTYVQDPAMLNTCNLTTGNVIKFDFGTTGAAKSYYQLTINQNVQVSPTVTAFYKGGVTTGCGKICYPGFGCKEEGPLEGCAFSQGYWFAKPGVVWPDVNGTDPGNVTIGGKYYTQAEGVAIWNTSNAKGISDAKKGFCQVAAILLSGDNVFSTASVWPYVATVQNWLSTKAKLSADGLNGTLKVQPKSAANTNTAAGTAAGSIGDWINTNHCDAW